VFRFMLSSLVLFGVPIPDRGTAFASECRPTVGAGTPVQMAMGACGAGGWPANRGTSVTGRAGRGRARGRVLVRAGEGRARRLRVSAPESGGCAVVLDVTGGIGLHSWPGCFRWRAGRGAEFEWAVWRDSSCPQLLGPGSL
jgi:hypothetical protein